jgi:hypothetical protein
MTTVSCEVAPVALSAAPTPMSVEQKFLFDLKGWILLPGVLEPQLLAEIREYLMRLEAARETLGRAFNRYTVAGPAQQLIDHPSIVGVLREIIAPDVSDDAYGFRCESSFFVRRSAGQAGFLPPHRGPDATPLVYRCMNGRIWSGLTRVVWELTAVDDPDGGTPVMSGSHKSNFPVPASLQKYNPRLYEGYRCPAGSAIIMSESCWHYGVEWKDQTKDRLAVFNCYNSYIAQWHRANIPLELLETMPLKRRSVFRGVWGRDVSEERDNDYFSPSNVAL